MLLQYVRALALASLLAASVLAVALGMHVRSQGRETIRLLSEQSHISFVRGLEAGLWARHGSNLKQYGGSQGFQEEMTQMLQNAPVYTVRLYGPQGSLLYTAGGTLDPATFQSLTQAALQNSRRAASTLMPAGDAGIQLSGDVTVARSFIAIGQSGVDGYAELYTDVSLQMQQLMLLQWAVIISIAGFCALLLLLMLLIYRKAENFIAVQIERAIELENAATTAREANQQKTQFLAGISHELRTPLNAIIGFSEIIRNDLIHEVKNETFKGYISDIHSSGVHLLSLINDILDFSKAEAGKLELEIEEINATKLSANCMRLVEPRAESGEVTLVNDLPKDPFVLETDGKKFKQILLNLLSNAVKFTPSNGTVTLSGWYDMATDTYFFEVTDTGIGIAPKDIAKALAPFGQVDNTLSRKYEGTGLGLPLTRKFIELMGGTFGLKSELHVGTTITFSLPRQFRPPEGALFKRVA